MKANGKFIFKSISKKDGGKFVNQNGQEITYNAKYVVKFDEVTEDGECFERKTNVSLESETLIQKLMKLDAYTPVIFQFEIGFNQSGITAKLVDCAMPKD